MSDPDNTNKFLKAQMRMTHIPHMNALGTEVIDFGKGHVTVRLPYNTDLVGNPETGVLAGGAISALLDNVCGSSVVAYNMTPAPFATLDLRIDYMKPATPELDVLAFAECYKMTKRIAFVRGIAYHESKDEPIANAAATFMFTGRGTINMIEDGGE